MDKKNSMLKSLYFFCADKYLQAFCMKHGYDYHKIKSTCVDSGNDISCNLGHCMVTFSGIRYDIDNHIKPTVFKDYVSYANRMFGDTCKKDDISDIIDNI